MTERKILIYPESTNELRMKSEPVKSVSSSVKKIIKDPYLNKPLTGKLKPVRTHHFFFKRSAYRIAFKIEKDIIVIMIATRENFYEKLEQRL